MISIKDYAKTHGVSYEAVRSQVARYAAREVDGFCLANHIRKVGRTQYIDDDGVAFLDERRSRSPVVIQQEERDETIERLRKRVDELQTRLIEAQDEYKALLQDKHEIEMREQALLSDKQMIDAIKVKAARAEGEAANARALAEQQATAAREAREEADRLRTEVDEAKGRADRMESAGLWARIFRSW